MAVSLHSSESKRFVICTCTLSFYYSFKDMVENTNPLDSRNRHSSTTFYGGFVVFTFPETFAILKNNTTNSNRIKPHKREIRANIVTF